MLSKQEQNIFINKLYQMLKRFRIAAVEKRGNFLQEPYKVYIYKRILLNSLTFLRMYAYMC